MKLTEKNVTKVMLVGAFVVSLGILLFVFATIHSPYTRLIRIEQLYALVAVTILYLYFVIPPLFRTFPGVTGRKVVTKMRDALVVVTWYFGLLHTLLVFFGQLGGFAGLPFLSMTYLVAISLSFSALILLCIYSIAWLRKAFDTSTKVRKKIVSCTLTVIGLLLLFHALMVGTHFSNLSSFIPQAFIVAFFILVGLESLRLDRWLYKKYSFKPPVGIAWSVVIVSFLIFTLGGLFLPNTPYTIGIHAEHLKSLEKAKNDNAQEKVSNFDVIFNHPDSSTAQTSIPLSFSVFTKRRNEPVADFSIVSEKYMHIIIVDSDLRYFNHIHPEKVGHEFNVATSFPNDGTYHIYTEFQPKNAPEQLFSFILPIGDSQANQFGKPTPDTAYTKQFGEYLVTLHVPQPLQAKKVTEGQTEITFTVRHANDATAVTNLRPYLGSFGHMVMINEANYAYYHVHPASSIPLKSDEEGGPNVSFYPMGMFQPVTPGIYRIFVQFNPNNELFTADFTVEIE